MMLPQKINHPMTSPQDNNSQPEQNNSPPEPKPQLAPFAPGNPGKTHYRSKPRSHYQTVVLQAEIERTVGTGLCNPQELLALGRLWLDLEKFARANRRPPVKLPGVPPDAPPAPAFLEPTDDAVDADGPQSHAKPSQANDRPPDAT